MAILLCLKMNSVGNCFCNISVLYDLELWFFIQNMVNTKFFFLYVPDAFCRSYHCIHVQFIAMAALFYLSGWGKMSIKLSNFQLWNGFVTCVPLSPSGNSLEYLQHAALSLENTISHQNCIFPTSAVKMRTCVVCFWHDAKLPLRILLKILGACWKLLLFSIRGFVINSWYIICSCYGCNFSNLWLAWLITFISCCSYCSLLLIWKIFTSITDYSRLC